MRALRALLARLGASLRALTGSPRDDDDLRAELECHLEMQIEENVRRGMSPDEARRQALIAAGGLAHAAEAAEAARDRRGLPLLENLVADFRYAARALRSKPGYCTAVILTLALGVGANSAMSVRAIRSLVYGTSLYDPWTFSVAAILLIGVSASASYVPARRASRVDPVIALRAE